MIWLKKCVAPSHPHEVVLPIVVVPATQLVGHRPITLLLAMMANIHYGLGQLVIEFLKAASNPCVELPYSYLMVWFVLHCPALMEPPQAAIGSFMLKLEDLAWTHEYHYNIRWILRNPSAYEMFCVCPLFAVSS